MKLLTVIKFNNIQLFSDNIISMDNNVEFNNKADRIIIKKK